MDQSVLTRLSPARPYDLRQSASGTAGGTRRWQGAVLVMALSTPAGPARAAVRQRPDGDLEVGVTGPDAAAALDAVRFVLATGDDHAPFLRMARRDPRMAPVSVRWPGYRPARRGSVAQAVIAAACGQLVTGRQAAQMERGVAYFRRWHQMFHAHGIGMAIENMSNKSKYPSPFCKVVIYSP